MYIETLVEDVVCLKILITATFVSSLRHVGAITTQV